jgi:hypothetical protein
MLHWYQVYLDANSTLRLTASPKGLFLQVPETHTLIGLLIDSVAGCRFTRQASHPAAEWPAPSYALGDGRGGDTPGSLLWWFLLCTRMVHFRTSGTL